MKTLTAIFFILILGATCLLGVSFKHTQVTHKEIVFKRDQFTNKDGIKTEAASKTTFMVCLGRYTSYFRTFMPFDEDPCNHLPSLKSVC